MGIGLYQKMLQKNIKNRTVFIHDNLEILQGVDSDSIDLIYLDPPFNKNKKFVTPIGEEKQKALKIDKDPAFADIFKKEDIKKEWLGINRGFIHHTRRIYSIFFPHTPLRMLERLLFLNFYKIFFFCIPKGTS